MKQCPRCSKIYNDDQLNFCLDDGELLSTFIQHQPVYSDDAAPTVVLDNPRITNPYMQGSMPGPIEWQPQPDRNPHFQPAMFGQLGRQQNKTLPILSLVLGILSLAMCWCGWLGVPAAILGFIGMRNADSDGGRYGGRGMAIAGLVMGIVSFAVFILFVIITATAN